MRLSCVLAIVPLLSGCCTNSHPTPKTAAQVSGPSLDRLLIEVQDALQNAQNVLDESHLPQLQSVRLALQTEAKVDGTGTLRIFVISVGGGTSASNSQELVLTLVPPKPQQVWKAAAPSIPTASDIVVALIKQAAQTVAAAKTGNVPLVAQSLTLDLVFTVMEKAGVGIVFNFGYVSVDVGGGAERLSRQRITITFA